MGTDLADREEADVCEDEWHVFSIAVTWFCIACRNYIPVAIKDIITLAIETRHIVVCCTAAPLCFIYRACIYIAFPCDAEV